MLQSRVRSVLVGAAVAIAAAFGGMGPAEAAVYRGAWDPDFGPAFPDLYWKGSATFFVPDACLAQSGWISNFNSCSGGDMEVLTAEVEFYNKNTSTFLESLNFDPQSMFQSFVLSMNIQNGQLAGVASGPSAVRQAFSLEAGGGDAYFILAFLGGPRPGALEGAKMYFVNPSCHDSDSSAPCYGASLDPSSEPGGPGTISFAPIPEPETYALMLAGLGAVVFMARRRRV